MNTRLGTLVTVLALAAASAQASPRDCGSCGMFGVARGQIARINVAHLGEPGSKPIQVEMLLLDATGAVVARDSQTIEAGQAVFFDVPYETVAGREDRIELRALVNAIPPPEPDKNLSTSVEIFDAETGKTAVFIGHVGR